MSHIPEFDDRFVRFPPRWRTVLVPWSPRRASALATTMYTACRPLPLLAQRALWGLTRVGGARSLPGRLERFAPPIDPQTFAGLYQDWGRAAGGSVDGLALHQRLQPTRPSSLVVLLCAGRDSMLIRVRRDPASLELERRISESARQLSPTTFHVPAVRASGERDGWHWIGYEVISNRPHAPARVTDPAMLAEVSELVESVVPRPATAPGTWRGAHGDLTPWNLRRANGTCWLIDWEDATWAPSGADHVYFSATTAALQSEPRKPLSFSPQHADAVAYWRDIVRQHQIVNQERRLQRRLEILLGDDSAA